MRGKRVWVIIMISLAILTNGNSAYAGNDVVLIHYFDRPPYFIKLSKQEITGMLIDITRFIFQESDISFEFINRPYKRTLNVMKEGKKTGMFCWNF